MTLLPVYVSDADLMVLLELSGMGYGKNVMETLGYFVKRSLDDVRRSAIDVSAAENHHSENLPALKAQAEKWFVPAARTKKSKRKKK